MPLTDVLSINGTVVYAGARACVRRRLPRLAKLWLRRPLLGQLMQHLEIEGYRGEYHDSWDTIVCTTCGPAPVLTEEFRVTATGGFTRV